MTPMITYEDAERIVRDRLDDITVDENSRCHWTEVANALTHILGELRAASSGEATIANLQAESGYLASINAELEATISRLTAERDGLRKIADEAGGLIEEIIASGTHTRWKRTANAIAEFNQAALATTRLPDADAGGANG